MLGKRINSVKKLAKKVVSSKGKLVDRQPSRRDYLVLRDDEDDLGSSPSARVTTPTGFFALYVGEERQRFVVPTGYLSHPLFKMLLDKASDEFGFQHNGGLVVPCSITTFNEVVEAVECCNSNFDFGNLVQDFI